MRRSGKFNFVEWPASAQTSVSCFVLRTGINLNLISLNVYLYILNASCYVMPILFSSLKIKIYESLKVSG